MTSALWLASEPALLPSRIQMAFTLASHVLLVPLGVALPSLTLLMEGIGLASKDPVALKIARRWSVVMAVQFAVGAVTGTILSFEFGILWPRMLGQFGGAFGLGFAIEAWAFFLEAIFIGIYLYGWERLRPRTHLLFGLVLPPAGLLGAFGVLASNSWMNTPAGTTLKAGKVVDVDVMAALFTRALGYEFWHFLIAIYMTAGFVVASVYAVAWLRGRRDHYQRLAFAVPFTVAAVLAPIQLVVGDLSARALVADQPSKFAAMEITWTTRDHNPEVIGGLIDANGDIHFGISVPSLDSLLVGYSPNAVVPGLTSVAANARPTIVEANITHLAFDLMVGLGSVGAALAVWHLWVLWRRRRPPESIWFYRLAALAGIGAYIAVETGWITTEVGRQPWIVFGVMRVADAVTTAPASFVWTMLTALVVIYALIAYFFVTLLLRLSARWRREDLNQPSEPEVGAPYGPRPRTFTA
ncbi:MAG: cytochrome ubiquinol oxidase subunit I [Chloroflexi bacterium]|nr:MAG: cytochrome ubiquinol oxidase subunit I [Chloroflexota bacterium]TMG12209.1 MAG: cytochrome ubiquinol oxidase subunit I [Chloroflexota bacterium]